MPRRLRTWSPERMGRDERIRSYVEKRTFGGNNSKRQTMRCLKK